tara:strand:- start:459 stop:695 length:237 start_codon:yes stop_codon:yes gene_type:complete
MIIKNNQSTISVKQFRKNIENAINKKTFLCIKLISEINISKYDQEEYVSIINEIYSEIFQKKFDTNKSIRGIKHSSSI